MHNLELYTSLGLTNLYIQVLKDPTCGSLIHDRNPVYVGALSTVVAVTSLVHSATLIFAYPARHRAFGTR